MNCWHCNTELIWQADHDLGDVYGTPEKGILIHLTCPSCNAFVEISLPIGDENEPSK